MRTPAIIILGSLIAIIFLFISFKKDHHKTKTDQADSKKSGVNLIDFQEKIVETPYEFTCETCFLSTKFNLDTFVIQILTPSNCMQSMGIIKLLKDTLNIYSGTKPDKVDTIIEFNDQTHKLDTTFVAELSIKPGPSHCMSILTYKVIGLKEKPQILRFNEKELNICSDKKSFVVKGNDTINIVDKFGLRQGLWVEYYKTGNIKRKDFYLNDIIQRGYEFDETGDTISTKWNQGTYNFEIQYNNK